MSTRTPTGAAPAETNPLLSGLGPAAWADRADRPDLTVEGHPKIVPLRATPNVRVHPRDPDPRGWPVFGADGVLAGHVAELWTDLSEPQIRYFEVDVEVEGAARRVLLPVPVAQIDKRRRAIRVDAVLARHFADVPGTRDPDVVTLLEEDRIQAYFGGGYLYAEPGRLGPLL